MPMLRFRLAPFPETEDRPQGVSVFERSPGLLNSCLHIEFRAPCNKSLAVPHVLASSLVPGVRYFAGGGKGESAIDVRT
jgi:hypothetical protein